jgi:phospholipid N-methyltransferase
MSQQWADYRVFLREFRRTFESTGAVLPSGQALSAALAHFVRAGTNECGPRRILEVGPGTGAVTQHIVQGMRPGDRLDLVERNEEFVSRLRARMAHDHLYRASSDRIVLRHASVEDISEDEPYNVIVSGLPLNNFPLLLVEQILAKLDRLLAPDGTLSFFEYIAIRKMKAALSPRADRDRLRAIGKVLDEFLAGREIRRDRVFANVPPAWVHHVRQTRLQNGSR